MHRGREGAGCHWRKKCVWCGTYDYNKLVDKGLCHVWVNGQCKRPGDVVGDPHSSPVPREIMREVVPTIAVPKPQLGMTSAEHEYQDYLSSHYDDHPSIIDYGYGKPTTHDAEEWKHLKYKPRWCTHCNGINVEVNCRTAHPYTFTIQESSQPVGANFMNLKSTEPTTFVNEDAWSIESECPSGMGEDPTEEVRCLEC